MLQWLDVLWDGDGVPLVNGQTAVKTLPSPFLRNAGDNNPQIYLAVYGEYTLAVKDRLCVSFMNHK